jgi:hypothetical protein
MSNRNYIENANYFNDRRVIASTKDKPSFDQKSMKITVAIVDDEGEEEVHELPAKFEVCSLCNGKGTHVNPSIDCNGITASEWGQWSSEEQEDYRNGAYDVSCHQCEGLRVVPSIDENKLSKDEERIFKLHLKSLEEEDDYERVCRMERIMGC